MPSEWQSINQIIGFGVECESNAPWNRVSQPYCFKIVIVSVVITVCGISGYTEYQHCVFEIFEKISWCDITLIDCLCLCCLPSTVCTTDKSDTVCLPKSAPPQGCSCCCSEIRKRNECWTWRLVDFRRNSKSESFRPCAAMLTRPRGSKPRASGPRPKISALRPWMRPKSSSEKNYRQLLKKMTYPNKA